MPITTMLGKTAMVAMRAAETRGAAAKDQAVPNELNMRPCVRMSEVFACFDDGQIEIAEDVLVHIRLKKCLVPSAGAVVK